MLTIDHEKALAQQVVEHFHAPDSRLFSIAWRHIVDTWAVSVAGSTAAPVAGLHTTLAPVPDGSGARVFGIPGQFSARDAACINGMAGHFHDYDDDDPNICIGHPSLPVVAALTAAAEQSDVTVAQFLAAYVVGVETTMHVGRMVNPSHYNRGRHCTASLGVLGAAAAVGVLRGASPQHILTALRLAATLSVGFKANFGTDAKPWQVGVAAAHGVWAAELAAAGLTVGENCLFGPGGMAQLSSDVAADSQARFGRPWGMVEPGMNIKLYPCCSSTHTAIDGILSALHETGTRLDEIADIEVWVGEDVPSILIHDIPNSGLEAKFSMRYCVAAAAVHGPLALAHFTDEALRHPRVTELMQRTRVHVDSSLPRSPTGVTHQSRVLLVRHDGGRVQREFPQPYGSAARPISQDDLSRKFSACVQPVLGPQACERLWRALENIDHDRPMRVVLDALLGDRT